MKYRVYCVKHRYDTMLALDSEGTAISAARMHSLLPCHEVRVLDSKGRIIEWREPLGEQEKKDKEAAETVRQANGYGTEGEKDLK